MRCSSANVQTRLEKLGWAVGRNVQIDFQWGLGDADWIRSAAAQLLRLAPDVILANGDAAAKTMQQSTRTVPVIFIAGSDAVADGLVQSLAHRGGNLTVCVPKIRFCNIGDEGRQGQAGMR